LTLATVDVPHAEKAENRLGTNLGTIVLEIPEFFCIKVLDKSKKVSVPKTQLDPFVYFDRTPTGEKTDGKR